MEESYYSQVNKENELKLRELIKELPKFCGQYFRGIEASTLPRTRLSYAYDLRVFFHYIIENNPSFKDANMRDIPISYLDQITAVDIEEYLDYIKIYENNNMERSNSEKGIKRKFSALRSFFNYFYKKEYISNNAPLLVDSPKIHDKAIIRLDVDEVAQLLDEVESGDKLTASQKKYHEKTKARDLALMTLLLGTGIRVSECVGLDINDVDFKNNGIKIHRKGGNEAIIYFGDEVSDVLHMYMEERKHILPSEGHEEALFLSLQKKRLGVRSVEKLVKKYAMTVTTLKKITPHKLRSTYGTTLYQETGDIYLVADVLGHKDVNTTRKHYAAIEENRRRSAANKVTLREKK